MTIHDPLWLIFGAVSLGLFIAAILADKVMPAERLEPRRWTREDELDYRENNPDPFRRIKRSEADRSITREYMGQQANAESNPQGARERHSRNSR